MLNICYATDNNYAPYLGIAMMSVIQSHPNEAVHFYILDNKISESNKIKLKSIIPNHCSLEFISVFDKDIESYQLPKHTF